MVKALGKSQGNLRLTKLPKCLYVQKCFVRSGIVNVINFIYGISINHGTWRRRTQLVVSVSRVFVVVIDDTVLGTPFSRRRFKCSEKLTVHPESFGF